MLRTRLWMGVILIALSAGVLVVDQWLSPWYPLLFMLVIVLSLVSCYELLQLLSTTWHPRGWLCYAAVTALVVANWVPHVIPSALLIPSVLPSAPSGRAEEPNAWIWIVSVFVVVVLTAFVVEMATFRLPGESVTRIALTVWLAAYLGLLPSFLVQLRWLGPADSVGATRRATTALALAIFVPKCGDSGAYFVGRFLGRHRLTPTLSPKKTCEGAVGGLAASILAAIGIDCLGPVVRGGVLAAAGLGAALGIAGMVGDLAESLIKRDCRQKDASQGVPGFGGVLDIVDSILFAAPVAYWWLT